MRALIFFALPVLAGCGGESQPNRAASALEADAAAPAQVAPQQWFERSDADGGWAGYGPPFSEAAFSLLCERAAGRLVFNTTEMPPSGPGATIMHLSANDLDQSIAATANEDGLPNTVASVPADTPWLSRLIAASGTLSVRVGDSDPLTVPIGAPLRSLIRDCARGGSTEARPS